MVVKGCNLYKFLPVKIKIKVIKIENKKNKFFHYPTWEHMASTISYFPTLDLGVLNVSRCCLVGLES